MTLSVSLIPIRRAARSLAAHGRSLGEFARLSAISCAFPLLLFAFFALTRRFAVPGLPRYDVILLCCLLAQWGLYRVGWETQDELKVIAVFHAAGLALELFKTHAHAWAYPEPGWTKLGGVPLYSGFMYASVASYLCQAWRRLDVHLSGWPPAWAAWTLAGAIYVNFFTEHRLPDLRWLLAGLILLIFRRTRAAFTAGTETYRMPMPLAFVLIGFFVWVAENIATYNGAWQYPNQHGGWHPVSLAKISSWSLLVVFSFLIVAQLKHIKELRPVGSALDRECLNHLRAGHHMTEIVGPAPPAISHGQ